MAIEIREEQAGQLAREDYEKLVPAVDRAVQRHGKVGMLVVVPDFHGWTMGALGEDTGFAVHHFRDIERLAVVGENKQQKGMATFCAPFTTATVRSFEEAQMDVARAWLHRELKMAA